MSKNTFNPQVFLVLKDQEEMPFSTTDRVVFFLSGSHEPQPEKVSFMGEDIPVLFGFGHENGTIYREDGKGNLIFNLDLLSSAFYLLSGQQETEIPERDQYGRFPYEHAIQNKLDSVGLPLVNYYFEMIIEGLEAYGKTHPVKIKRSRLFENFGFTLSHDVDRIAFFHPIMVLYRIKQLLRLAPLSESWTSTLKLFFQGVFFNLNPFRGHDPWWNFDWMIDVEKRLGIRSTFFFLKQEDRFDNSLYQFHHRRIKKLIAKLMTEGFEIGLHGTVRSTTDKNNLQKQTSQLARVTGEIPVGIRQHYLRFKHPLTFKIQQDAGFVYDTSLAFAEHDGYRNSYCHPFHPYDFGNDCMMKIWEVPLVMMEVSVLGYRNASFETIREAVTHYISEARKFGGIFSLLWHNCRLSDVEFKGIAEFYVELLGKIVEEKPEVLKTRDIVNKLKTR